MIGEMKTKPTQYAVRSLNMAGIQPDIILARSVIPLDEPRKRKISIFCNVAPEDVISAPDIKSIYEIPINFEKENLGNQILKKFGQKPKKNNLRGWANLVRTIKRAKKPVKIGIVGKYFETGKFTLMDSYISIIEAIKQSCWFHKRKPEIYWLGSEKYDPIGKPSASYGARKNLEKDLKNLDGVIVPGGFGDRGVEGKIKAIEYCRKNKIPFLGLCLGMQLSVVEFARNVCKIKKACSVESSQRCRFPVIDVMPEQKALISEKKYGGTMRLGAYKCKIMPETISFRAYSASPKPKKLIVNERHRHRYELNNNFRKKLEVKGMIMAGINPKRNLVEIIELPTTGSEQAHPFFVATQFHPEFKSRPLNPHPLFREFIRACLK